MRSRYSLPAAVIAAMVLIVPMRVCRGGQMLIYDEEKGIILVDKETGEPVGREGAKAAGKQQEKPAERPLPARTHRGISTVKKGEDIHTGRKKDPPEVYFKSGLEYYKNKDFEGALRNFLHTDSTDPKPKYALWIGKTYRQLGRNERMMVAMSRILNAYPDSDVADDALFEIAFHYQVAGDYDSATYFYTLLAEQYPFGTSFSNGEEFRDIAREQCRLMRGEIISTLNLLGYEGDDLNELYRAFQVSHGLDPAGKGNRETVNLIKSVYEEMLEKNAMIDARTALMKKQSQWILAGGGAVAINLLLMISILVQVKKKRKHLQSLVQTLSGLNAGNL